MHFLNYVTFKKTTKLTERNPSSEHFTRTQYLRI